MCRRRYSRRRLASSSSSLLPSISSRRQGAATRSCPSPYASSFRASEPENCKEEAMGILQSIRPAIAAASLFALGVTASSLSLAHARAETVDVTKDSWWLTPYKASKPWTIGVSYTDTSISYIAALQKAVQAKAMAMGVKIIEVDAKNDTNVELANVESLLQQHIDLLLLEGASLKASVASIEAANKAKVPVVHFNILAEGGEYVTFVGSNQIDSG